MTGAVTAVVAGVAVTGFAFAAATLTILAADWRRRDDGMWPAAALAAAVCVLLAVYLVMSLTGWWSA